MNKYRKAIVAVLVGLAGAAGVAVSVTADNEFSLYDGMAILSAGLSALIAAAAVAVTSNES